MNRLTVVAAAVVGIAAVAVAGLVTTLIVALRTNDRRVIDTFTRFQRDHINPAALRTAGTAGDRYAVVEHVGRRSGRAYETPVGAVRDGDDWYILLVYGEQTSWAQNLLSADAAVLRADGERRRVTGAAIVPVDTTPLGRSDPGAIRLMGIRSALRLHDAGPA